MITKLEKISEQRSHSDRLAKYFVKILPPYQLIHKVVNFKQAYPPGSIEGSAVVQTLLVS